MSSTSLLENSNGHLLLGTTILDGTSYTFLTYKTPSAVNNKTMSDADKQTLSSLTDTYFSACTKVAALIMIRDMIGSMDIHEGPDSSFYDKIREDLEDAEDDRINIKCKINQVLSKYE